MWSMPVAVVEGIGRVLQLVGQVVLAFMAVTICYDALARYLIAAPTTWSLEVNSFLLVYLAVMTAADTLRRGEQISITLLPEKLAPRPRAILVAAVSLVGIVFSWIIAWRGYLMAHDAWAYGERVSSVFGTHMVVPYALLPIGFGVLGAQFAIEAIRALTTLSVRRSW